MKSRFDVRYYFDEGVHSIFTHGMMSFAAVCMIIACLLIMGSFSLLAVNISSMLGELEKENEFLAYVDESLTVEQAKALQTKLEAIPNVASAAFVSREEALKAFLEGRESNELLDDLPAEVLRHRYCIHVDDIEQMSSTVDMVEQVAGIAKVSAALEIAQGFVVVRNVASGIAAILTVILFIISLFIISNTIKLATFTRREEIAIMKMCGATNSFVQWPFVFEGLLLGLAGAVVAFFLQWGVYSLVLQSVTQSGGISLITIVPFADLAQRVLLVFVGSGFAIGVGGSLLAIRKFLLV